MCFYVRFAQETHRFVTRGRQIHPEFWRDTILHEQFAQISACVECLNPFIFTLQVHKHAVPHCLTMDFSVHKYATLQTRMWKDNRSKLSEALVLRYHCLGWSSEDSYCEGYRDFLNVTAEVRWYLSWKDADSGTYWLHAVYILTVIQMFQLLVLFFFGYRLTLFTHFIFFLLFLVFFCMSDCTIHV